VRCQSWNQELRLAARVCRDIPQRSPVAMPAQPLNHSDSCRRDDGVLPPFFPSVQVRQMHLYDRVIDRLDRISHADTELREPTRIQNATREPSAVAGMDAIDQSALVVALEKFELDILAQIAGQVF